MAQLRGNGGLTFTRKALRFYQVMPRQDIDIPLASVTETALVRVHLGKTVGRMLFKVIFVRDGATDSIAWYVADAELWKRQVDAMRAVG